MDTISKTVTVTKLPQVTLIFWVMKIAATTVGETGGDMLAQTLNVGYGLSTLILLSVFLVTLVVQLRASRFSPALYWTAILCSNTLGTALGDYLSDSSGLGFGGGALLIASLIAVVAVLHSRTQINKMVLFWAAFVLTRPLGATVGDLFTKPPSKGGLGFGTYGATAVLVAVLVSLIIRTNRNGALALAAAGDPAGDCSDAGPERGERSSMALVGRSAPEQGRVRRRRQRILRTSAASARQGGLSRGKPNRGEYESMTRSTERQVSQPPEEIASRECTMAERGCQDLANLEAFPALAAESAGRIQAEAEAMATRVRQEAAAFAEAQQAFTSRMFDAQRIRHDAEVDAERTRRQAEAEADELRTQAELESLGIIEAAKAGAAEWTAQAERHIQELQVAETEMVDRLQRAEMLWQALRDTLRPKVVGPLQTPPTGPAFRIEGSSLADEPFIDLEASVADVSPGNGPH